MAAGHALDAVLAAGELRAQAVEVEHLRQRERDHREVDALAADGDDANPQAQRSTHPHREEDRELGWPSPGQRRVRARVAGSAEEEGMAKGKEPHVSDQEVEGAGEEREAEHLHGEEGIDDPGSGDHSRDQHHDRNALGGFAGLDALDGGFGHACFPNRPAGRTSSTIAITTKMTVLEASG